MANVNQQLDAWIDAHFEEQIAFLQALVRVPTDTPPGNNAPHARRTVELLAAMGLQVDAHPVPEEQVREQGMESITNLIVRRQYDSTGPTIALNAHGDVVPPGEGWTTEPYGAGIENGRLYGRAAAVSKSDFATYSFALRAIESLGASLHGALELHFTYDEEFGGELGPGWLIRNKLTQPDYVLAAGFSYEVINAHNGCLQLEVTVHGNMAHAAIPDSGVDALQGTTGILQALYAKNDSYRCIQSSVAGITHPYLNVGWIAGGTNTNVVPGKVVLRLDRRMIPEEDPVLVEKEIRETIEKAAVRVPALRVEIRRLMLARALQAPVTGNLLAETLQRHATDVMGESVPIVGTPLYTDVRLYAEAGAVVAIYGAGPRTVLESNAKRADEHLVLADLRSATRVVARSVYEMLADR